MLLYIENINMISMKRNYRNTFEESINLYYYNIMGILCKISEELKVFNA